MQQTRRILIGFYCKWVLIPPESVRSHNTESYIRSDIQYLAKIKTKKKKTKHKADEPSPKKKIKAPIQNEDYFDDFDDPDAQFMEDFEDPSEVCVHLSTEKIQS